MPGGSTQLWISASLSQADSLLPRFMLTAVCRGLTTSISTNTMPIRVSGPVSERPSCAAPTTTPIATAKTAGMIPLISITAHQATVSRASALGSAAKNCHSCRARSRSNMFGTLPLALTSAADASTATRKSGGTGWAAP